MTRDALKKDILGALIFGLVFAASYFYVGSLPVKAKMWPNFICLAGIICCIMLAGKSFLAMKKLPAEAEKKQQDAAARKAVFTKAALTVGIVAVWFLVMDFIGFIVTSSLATFGLMCVPAKPETRRQMWLYGGISLAFTVVLWLSFGLVLGAKLPEGYLF